jgi:hypothetical protein
VEEKRKSTSRPKRGQAKAAPSTITQLEEEPEGLTTYGGVDDCQSNPRPRRGTRKTASPYQGGPKSCLVHQGEPKSHLVDSTPKGDEHSSPKDDENSTPKSDDDSVPSGDDDRPHGRDSNSKQTSVADDESDGSQKKGAHRSQPAKHSRPDARAPVEAMPGTLMYLAEEANAEMAVDDPSVAEYILKWARILAQGPKAFERELNRNRR